MARALLSAGVLACLIVAGFSGCTGSDAEWPPPPRNAEEQAAIDSARKAVQQFDGWSEVAYVVQRRQDQWLVQAWKIVNPKAKGRNRCVPWASRGIRLDRDGTVIAYENHP